MLLVEMAPLNIKDTEIEPDFSDPEKIVWVNPILNAVGNLWN